MKATIGYALGGAVIGYAVVALFDKNWKSKLVFFGAGGGAVVGLAVGVYFDTPKTADDIFKADAENKKAAGLNGKIDVSLPKVDVGQLTKEQADAIVKTIIENQRSMAAVKHDKDYVDPNLALLKKLKDAGYMISNGEAKKMTAGTQVYYGGGVK